jgi:hypothetical protein
MKIHLASSDTSLKLGTDLVALCQAIVPHAEAAFFFNERAEIDYVDILMDSRICWQCRKELSSRELPDGYVYGLLSGQDVMNEKSEREAEAVA